MNRIEATKLLAHAFCEASGTCPCRGDYSRCHAPTIYAAEAARGIVKLERAGVAFEAGVPAAPMPAPKTLSRASGNPKDAISGVEAPQVPSDLENALAGLLEAAIAPGERNTEAPTDEHAWSRL